MQIGNHRKEVLLLFQGKYKCSHFPWIHKLPNLNHVDMLFAASLVDCKQLPSLTRVQVSLWCKFNGCHTKTTSDRWRFSCSKNMRIYWLCISKRMVPNQKPKEHFINLLHLFHKNVASCIRIWIIVLNFSLFFIRKEATIGLKDLLYSLTWASDLVTSFFLLFLALRGTLKLLVVLRLKFGWRKMKNEKPFSVSHYSHYPLQGAMI